MLARIYYAPNAEYGHYNAAGHFVILVQLFTQVVRLLSLDDISWDMIEAI